MKPTVQDEDMEDDLAAEEENKLINEVSLTIYFLKISSNLAGRSFFRSTKHGRGSYSALVETFPNNDTSTGKRTRRICMTLSSRTHWTGRV
jgi:hypothetical protein